MSSTTTPPLSHPSNVRRDVALLLLASFASVLAILLALVLRQTPDLSFIGMRQIGTALLVGIGASCAMIVYWQSTATSRRDLESARAELVSLRRALASTDAIIASEPQVLIFWDIGEQARISIHSLRDVPGVPEDEDRLLEYGDWLEPESAREFQLALDALFEQGNQFNVILKTLRQGQIEADGRAAGGRAVVRLRDVAGYRKKLGQIQELQQTISRDIRSARELLDALPHPVWLRSEDGRITWVNRAYVKAVEATGTTEVVERQVELLETRQRRVVERALSRRESYRARVPIALAGARKAHDIIALPIGSASAAAAIDVAELEATKDEVSRLSAAFDRTLDRVATAVAIFDSTQRLTYFNKAYLDLWRIDREWLASGPSDGAVLDRLKDLGRLPEMVKYREWKSKLLESYASGLDNEDWWHLPDGRVIHAMGVVRPDGGLTYLYVDETERLALESRHNALTRVQGETLDSLKEGVAVFATDGRLKLHNQAFAAIWRLPRALLDEAPHIDTVITAASALFADPVVWRRIAEAVTSFSPSRETIEGQMVRPDGTVIDFAATPLPDGAILLTFADVTDAKRYERALVERNEALITADRLKNRFIGHVSYELRTPLTNIIGFSELLASPRTGDLNTKQKEYLGDLTASSRTLLAIIDDILDLATIDAGALELKYATVDVREVISGAVRGIEDRARHARLTLDIGISEDARAFLADESRVRQMLYNLLSNAVGFSKPGGTVYLAAWREADHMVFAVQDEGVGIPPDQQARVFERFESQAFGSQHRGAGLGLPIVKSLADLHGGAIELQSEVGVGTRVTLRLPIAGRAVDSLGAAPQALTA